MNTPRNIQESQDSIDYSPGQGEMSLKELILHLVEWLRYLFSKWLLIAIISFVIGVMGLVYASIQEPIYTAELSFVLEDDQSNSLGGYANIAGQFGIDLGGSAGGGAFAGDNLLALMKSRSMVEKALLTVVTVDGKKQTLAEFYIDIYKLRPKWIKKGSLLKDVHFMPGLIPSQFSLQQQSLINSFHKNLVGNSLSVEREDKKSSIIVIQVNSENEIFSKLFTEALAKEVSDFYIETKTKKSVQNLAILQHQTDSVKRAFNSAISGAAISTDANPNPNAAMQLLKVPSQKRLVDVQINQAILTQLVQNLEIAKISLRKETPLIQIIDRPVLPLIETKPNPIISFLKWAIIGMFLTCCYLLGKKLIKDFLA